jgi:hypothetical protein
VSERRDKRKEVVLSLRVAQAELDRVDEVAKRYHSLLTTAGFSPALPPATSRAAVLRFAIAEGLAVMEAKLDDEETRQKKKGARR